MSRKSLAALTTVTPLIAARDPPEGMTDEQAVVWREVVASKPPDWFDGGNLRVLVGYCELAIDARRLNLIIEAFDVNQIADGTDFKRYRDLMAMRKGHVEAMTTLARQMRLTQQSKYGARHAEAKSRPSAVGSRPWQRKAAE